MIKLVELTKIYNSGESVGIGIQNINLELHLGEFVGIVGTSGSGKTTLLNIISGMDTYSEGEMFIDGKSTANFDSEELENYRRANVAFIFQNYQLIDAYTAFENVYVELLIKGLDKKEAKAKTLELLEKVGMLKSKNTRASKLSGGEKQRIVIARALASDAKILACDEPTGNLDVKSSKEIMDLIKEVAKDKLVLFVTHDESIIKNNITRIIRVRDGNIESDTQLVESNKQNIMISEPLKTSLKTKWHIAFKNLYRTPKKTIFLFLVFFIVSFVIMFSLAYINFDITATKDKEIEYNMFDNKDDDRIIVYKSDESKEINIPNTIVLEDDYVLDYNFRGATTSVDLRRYIYDDSKLCVTKDHFELISGRMPNEEADNEIVVILDKNFSKDFCDKIISEEPTIRFSFDIIKGTYFSEFFDVVGIGLSENVEENVSYYYTNYNGAVNYIESLKSYIHVNKNCVQFIEDFRLESEGKIYNVKINNELKTEEIQINFKYRDKDIALYIGNKQVDLTQFDHSFVYNDNYFDVQMSYNTAMKLIDTYNYRVSVYAEASNIESVIEELRKDSSLEIFPIIEAKLLIQEYDYNGIFENVFNLCFVVVVIIAAVIIAYLITSLILKTKRKELSVLRVIGLNKKDVLHILNIEVLTIMSLTIILNIVVGIISKVFNSPLSYHIIFNNPFKLILSILILLCISFYISLKWNRKMFKKTAQEVLKDGEFND